MVLLSYVLGSWYGDAYFLYISAALYNYMRNVDGFISCSSSTTPMASSMSTLIPKKFDQAPTSVGDQASRSMSTLPTSVGFALRAPLCSACSALLFFENDTAGELCRCAQERHI